MKKLNAKGQGMTEYILIVALIAVAAIAVVKIFGGSIQAGFHGATQAVSGAVGSSNAAGVAGAAAAGH
jgi:type IV pilus assembly protein PilA